MGTKVETKTFKFRWILGPPTKTSYTTPHNYPKYEVKAIEFSLNEIHFDLFKNGSEFLGDDPFNF